MEGVEKAANGSGAEINDSAVELSMEGAKVKDKGLINEKDGEIDAVRLNVSDPTLVEGLKILKNLAFEIAMVAKSSREL